MKVAIIPARGGSKRIPLKNIRLFHGKPMIVWSIEAALASGCFDKVIVSTDDKQIADIAIEAGAEVPFIRPDSISDDLSGTSSVVCHAINWLNKAIVNTDINKFSRYDKLNMSAVSHVCCIYATAPFISAKDINKGLEALISTKSDYAIAVTKFNFPIQRAVLVNSVNRLEMYQPKYFSTRSQDLPEAYHDVGQFCWGTPEAWLKNKVVFLAPTVPVMIPSHRAQDIDTEDDWLRAEIMFSASSSREKNT
ncbi:pseudaminic acid cytidylyltransferase [Shewanella sp. 10N.7]|uniref:pseudaminic acid cytidylyltransferase n=1 Tax=Shewanella sp. 10N.7 TaxID=2885093 RepID=UPI001E3C9B94|nr:pseudaminic acid cytidylyltransferase [Shewanella sp. 10N.7]MCC4832692.1 pseudaminic acid cytidylyltransferase [Shewanella sp. 10N.7]